MKRELDQGRGIVVVIGSMKSGTSSLHNYLDLHPEVRMSRVKELNFFTDENWGRGLDWYQRQLESDATIRGESSPNYTKFPAMPGVPQRMHGVLPNAKLIYVVREPVSRILSHYQHNVSHGRERRTLDQALRESERGYVFPSLYHFQLERFLEHYAREQLLVVDQRDLKADRQSVMQRIFRFLGVDSGFFSPKFERLAHESRRKRRPTRLGHAAYKVKAIHSLRDVLPWPLTEPLEPPVVSAELRSWLDDRIEPDVARLRRLTGLELASWGRSESATRA